MQDFQKGGKTTTFTYKDSLKAKIPLLFESSTNFFVGCQLSRAECPTQAAPLNPYYMYLCVMDVQQTEQVTKEPSSGILSEARAFVLSLFNKHQDARYVFHNYPLAVAIVEKTDELVQAEGMKEESREVCLLAAWLVITGRLLDYQGAKEKSLGLARQFLSGRNYPKASQESIYSAIQNVYEGHKAVSKEAIILSDAFQIVVYLERFPEAAALQKVEQEFVMGRELSKASWATFQLQELLGVHLKSDHAKVQYEPVLAQLIQQQKEVVRKLQSNRPEEDLEDEGQLRKFQDLEKKIPNRATQTFFRANYRNHINLSAIADNKANIMISVNTALIIVLISFISYNNKALTNPLILLPVILFLVTGLASLVFAVLSARPKVTMVNTQEMSVDTIQKNIVFFGNFVTLNLDQYEEAMDAMLRDGELLYGNMVRDMYYLGKVLEKKYRFLSISYNIFMVGFIATVGTFLYALFGG